MADIVSKKQRSRNMAAIGPRGSKAEEYVRSVLDAREINYQTNVAGPPGKPDLVVPELHSIVLVHGCFWHGHGCKKSNWPEDNSEFWRHKISGTMNRDKRNLEKYRIAGYWVLTVWECATRGKFRLPEARLDESIYNWLLFETRNRAISGKGQPRASVGVAE